MAIKTNERPGTRAVLRYCRMSGYKAREVLDLIRGVELQRALELLDHTERAAAPVIAKLVRSAAANAEHNDGLDPDELYVAACFADEGTTLKRWRPRARGRATRIRKRTCHITVILARMDDEQLARKRAKVAAEAADRRARRVAGTRRRQRGETEAARSTADAPVAAEAGATPDWVGGDEVVEDASVSENARTSTAGSEWAGTDADVAEEPGTEESGTEESGTEGSGTGATAAEESATEAQSTVSDDVAHGEER